MKKSAVILALALILSLAACGGDEKESASLSKAPTEEVSLSAADEDSLWDEGEGMNGAPSAEGESEGLLIYGPDDEYMDFVTMHIPFQGDVKDIVGALVAHGSLPGGSAVNHFSINGDTVYIDMNDVYYNAVCAGTTSEWFCVGCLVNTVIDYYADKGVKYVVLTVNDEYMDTPHAGLFDYPIGKM